MSTDDQAFGGIVWYIMPRWQYWSLNHLLATVHTWYLKVWSYRKETARHKANKVTQSVLVIFLITE